jgi:hypothetical protein
MLLSMLSVSHDPGTLVLHSVSLQQLPVILSSYRPHGKPHHFSNVGELVLLMGYFAVEDLCLVEIRNQSKERARAILRIEVCISGV